MTDGQMESFLAHKTFCRVGLLNWSKPGIKSGLSSVLQELHGEELAKYQLSPQACAGILRRARRKGKALPPRLEAVLKEIAGIDGGEVSVNENGSGDVWLSPRTGALTTGGGKPGQGFPCVLYQFNPTDARVTEEADTAPTTLARYGTGGNQTPLVVQGGGE